MIGAGYTGGYQLKVPQIEIKEKFAWILIVVNGFGGKSI